VEWYDLLDVRLEYHLSLSWNIIHNHIENGQKVA